MSRQCLKSWRLTVLVVDSPKKNEAYLNPKEIHCLLDKLDLPAGIRLKSIKVEYIPFKASSRQRETKENKNVTKL